MRQTWLFMAIVVVVVVHPLGAQTLTAGFSGGWTTLGGMGPVLGLTAPAALSGGVFVDVAVVSGQVARLAAQFAQVEGTMFSSFETDLLWRFPLGNAQGFAGAGMGLLGVPVELSAAIHFLFQGVVGMEQRVFHALVVTATFQASQVVRLNRPTFPGQPLLRLEVGIGLPFAA